MHHRIPEMPASVPVRLDWGSPIESIQIPNQKSPISPFRIPVHGANLQPYLVVSNPVLLVCRAEGDGRYDCPSARIWVRPDVDGACAKAVECLPVAFLWPIQVGRSVDGGSQGDWGHDNSLWGCGRCGVVGLYFVIVAIFLWSVLTF